ncbi:MAG: toxin TcdB middle/N-terminal domain-containing protein [Marinagarivorans sp.]|nr:toxin TcdB middle/N-terminal domain-containing protein [Marinagarivorans sp.]
MLLLAGKRGQPDLLTTITDGFGAQIKIDYDTLHSDAIEGRPFYTQAPEHLPWPNERASRSMNVVKQIQNSDGLGGFTTERFYYEGGWYNYHKRKFVGFQKITHIDVDRNIVTDTFYNLEMPFHGTVAKVETKTSNGQWLARTTNHFVQHPQNQRFVYNDYTIAETYNLQANPVSVVRSDNTYDQYGAVAYSRSTVGNGLSGTTVTGVIKKSNTTLIPSHNLERWLLGFVTQTTTTTSHGNGNDVRTVVNKYTAEPNTLDVKTSTLFFGTPWQQTVTQYRDRLYGANAGVVTRTVSTAIDATAPVSAERSATLKGFEDGVYPTQSVNAKGHITTLGYDKRVGKVNYTRDANGLTNYTTYDALGRSIEEKSPTGNRTQINGYFCSNSPYACPTYAVYASTTQTTHPSEGSNLAAPVTVSFYDSLQRVIRTETITSDGVRVKQDTEYDTQGRVLSVSEPYTGSYPQYFTQYSQFNAMGVAEYIEADDGGSLRISTSQRGDLVATTKTVTIANSNSTQTQTSTTYTNALGQVVKVEDDATTPINYTYDSQGNLSTTQVNNNASTTVFVVHDYVGRKNLIKDPAAGVIEFTYNGFGELRQQIWQKGHEQSKKHAF